MNFSTAFFSFSVFFSLFSLSLLSQEDLSNQEIHIWFQEERFLIADEDNNALLDKEEMQSYENEFAYFLAENHYDLTDQNKDKFISFKEILARTKVENAFRYARERKQLRELATDYPFLRQADETYLKNNPILTAKLFTNLCWLYEHPDLAKKIYEDKSWTNKHIEVLHSLHNNLRWMAANPFEAKNLYKNKKATINLPHLLGWRSHHKEFIQNHVIAEKFYELEFIPEGLRLNR